MQAIKFHSATLLALVVLALSAPSVFAQGVGESKRILMLFTHQSDQPAQVVLENAMRATLKDGSQNNLEIYTEYLDAVRTPLDDYEKELVGQLQRKYSRKKFDLIFAINPPALKVLSENRAALFPDTPIVFLVLNQSNVEGLILGSNVTGIWGELSYRSNLELALALHPGTKKVVVISGISEWDNYWRSLVEKEFQGLEKSVEISYLTGLTVSELKQTLAQQPPSTVVFFISSTEDKAGNNISNLEVVRQISPVSSAPIYGNSDAQLGLGIVGGRLTSFEAFGIEAARVGLRVMAGEKPEAISPHGVPAVPMFDWRELNRWGIQENRLPAGSVVRFKVPTFWQQYWGRILGAIIIFALQSLFIGWLLVERKRRQRVKESLDRLNAELEERITARTAALNAKSTELETFAYSVAHDLKAPLRGIEGYSRLLLEDHADSLSDEGRSFLTTIKNSTDEMDQLIEDLLDYSRLERREFESSQIPLQPLVKSVVAQKERETTDRKIEFVVNVNGGAVMADSSGLAQALKNYIDNAVKFTRDTPQALIEIGSEETSHSCLLWVRDNGIGFDMKYQHRIFDIFQRLNHSEDYQGTGIGLAIVRKAMERMGGRAWAESEIGKGATFYLEIPKNGKK
jgi:signal transduction histidine kinase